MNRCVCVRCELVKTEALRSQFLIRDKQLDQCFLQRGDRQQSGVLECPLPPTICVLEVHHFDSYMWSGSFFFGGLGSLYRARLCCASPLVSLSHFKAHQRLSLDRAQVEVSKLVEGSGSNTCVVRDFINATITSPLGKVRMLVLKMEI